MASRAVVVEDLQVHYGRHHAVRGATFACGAGQIYGLLGPNGAGKTSIIRALVGLHRPSSGRVTVLGHDVAEETRQVRRLIGYVPQAVSADGSLTGRENAILFAKLYGVERARRRVAVEEVLELMGLGDAADRLVSDYSGGMIRRLEIACALVSDPRLLVLDEPTLGLDPGARRSVWEHLGARRTATDMTVLVTTHYMEEAQQHCDVVAVLSEGRVVAEGTPDDVRASVSGSPSLEDVFIELTRSQTEAPGGGMRQARRARGAGRRLG